MWEYALLLIKPDAVRLNLTSEILDRVNTAGLESIFVRRIHLTPQQAAELYQEHRTKDFFERLTNFMTSGPCEACVVGGESAIKRLDELCGHNDPQKAAPGTLRSLFGTGKSANAVHSSSDCERFQIELGLLLQTSSVLDLGAGDD